MDIDKKFVLNFDELKFADLPLDEFFSLQVTYNEVEYKFLIRFSSTNESLICLGSGGNNSPEFKPYNRHSLLLEFEESMIFYGVSRRYNHDKEVPSFIGEDDLLSIKDILSILVAKNHIEKEDVVFTSRSNRDFSPIILSTLFEGSSAIINYSHSVKEEYDEELCKKKTIECIRNHFQKKSEVKDEINYLKKELKVREQKIIELQTIRGYMDYKVKNLSMRFENKVETLWMKVLKPYHELHKHHHGIDYSQLTIVIPYSKSDDPHREENLDITVRYLSSIGVDNVIISELSDVSTKDYLMEKYGNLFKSFHVIHTDTNGGLFNLARARNIGIIHSTTPYIAISDLDCITKKKNIDIALGLLNRGYDVIHPFNRRVTDIKDKQGFVENYDFQTVKTPEQNRTTADGGIVFWNKHSFVSIGMLNEYFVGWGGEDNEIMFRAKLCGLKHCRIDDTLYHLYHHRPQKRTWKNRELEEKARQMSKSECLKEISKWPWVKEAKKKFSYYGDEFSSI